mmetsp:Transcript_29331/g.75612  ORF Transcript_29331/g.75612 Transcript_29331/m.75612 type:complete len:95 (-) Transcript_29331:1997-2281(-)
MRLITQANDSAVYVAKAIAHTLETKLGLERVLKAREVSSEKTDERRSDLLSTTDDILELVLSSHLPPPHFDSSIEVGVHLFVFSPLSYWKSWKI